LYRQSIRDGTKSDRRRITRPRVLLPPINQSIPTQRESYKMIGCRNHLTSEDAAVGGKNDALIGHGRAGWRRKDLLFRGLLVLSRPEPPRGPVSLPGPPSSPTHLPGWGIRRRESGRKKPVARGGSIYNPPRH
jgi:hypothetical protein